jgi:hypothetical protein
MSIADLLPQVPDILPLTDIDAANKMCRTLCDVIESTLTVPPAPTHEAVAVPALTPQEFLFSALLDGPQPAKAVERMAREQHGWRPKVLFKARWALKVKAVRRGFGPGGRWVWKLPGYMTNKNIYFHPGEWRDFIADHRHKIPTLTVNIGRGFGINGGLSRISYLRSARAGCSDPALTSRNRRWSRRNEQPTYNTNCASTFGSAAQRG